MGFIWDCNQATGLSWSPAKEAPTYLLPFHSLHTQISRFLQKWIPEEFSIQYFPIWNLDGPIALKLAAQSAVIYSNCPLLPMKQTRGRGMFG